MRCGQPRDAERARAVEHVAPGLGRIAESPLGPRNPIAELDLAIFAAVDADAADQARRARGAADRPDAAGMAGGPAGKECLGIGPAIGPAIGREACRERVGRSMYI